MSEKLSKADILGIAKKLHVLSIDESAGDIRVLKPCKISSQSCIWNGTPIAKAKIVKMYETFIGVHSYGHPSLFKPSMEEVIRSMSNLNRWKVSEGEINAVIIQYDGFTGDNEDHKSIITPVKCEFDRELTDIFTEWE